MKIKKNSKLKNDLQTMEMVLKEYLDYSEKINVKRISSINILNLIIEVTNSSNDLKKKQRYHVIKIFFLKPTKIIYLELFLIYVRMHQNMEKIFLLKLKKNLTSFNRYRR